MRHRDVAPPVHGRGAIRGIEHAHARVQHRRAVRQREVHLIDHAAHALVFVHAQHRRAVVVRQARGEQRRAGKGRVPENAAVPFHAARAPGVARGQVRRPRHRIGEQQLLSRLFVVQAPQLAAHRRREAGPQAVVFQDDPIQRLSVQRARIVVLRAVWERAFDEIVAQVEPVALGNVGRHEVVLCLHLIQHGQRALRAQVHAFHVQLLLVQPAHRSSSFRWSPFGPRSAFPRRALSTVFAPILHFPLFGETPNREKRRWSRHA